MDDVLRLLERRLAQRSAWMVACCGDLGDAELRTQFDAEFSPIGWHLGHVAWQEEVWVLRNFCRRPALVPKYDDVFDSFRPGKAERGNKLPDKQALFDYRAQVRASVLECLPDVLADTSPGLMNGAGLIRFVANHESQHRETVLAIRIAAGLALSSEAMAGQAWHCPLVGEQAFVPCAGGSALLGSGDDPERWDNEGSPHRRHLPAFALQQYPVSNADWLEFLEQGGYQDERLWSSAGWGFVRRHQLSAPLYWRRASDGGWQERTLWGEAPLEASRPVTHVSWFEAQAFARFAGARLPSEAEWEWAARCPPASQRVEGLVGSVWQWTSSVFSAYPGFEAQAYSGYSVPWFDGRHKVARGGASVTSPEIARPTFRNWYLPEMRRPFLGVRLAKGSR